MDESSQQAISLGFNVTVFVVALSASLALIFGVRDIADVASEVDNSIPDGNIIYNVESEDDRIISGYEVISYYYNYIKPYYKDDDGNNEYNHANIGVVIKTNTDTYYKKVAYNGNISTEEDNKQLSEFVEDIDLNAMYTLNIENHYDSTGAISGITNINIEQIPVKTKSEIYTHYTSKIKPLFEDESHNLFEDSKLRVVINKSNTYLIDLNEDSENNDREFKKIRDELEAGKTYNIRLKKLEHKIGQKASKAILHIDAVK